MFLTNPYLNYFLVILSLLIILLLITFFINRNKEKLLFTEIELFVTSKKMTFEKVEKRHYDFIMKNDARTFYCKVVKIPSNSSVTINSKNTWCLRFGGKRKGRSYPNKRYLNEVEPFIKMKLSNDTDMKVIILYPSTETILKYQNESEICEVKPIDTPYGYKVISYNFFNSMFDDLLKTKNKKLS